MSFAVVQVVPTGVGAAIGGFVGDATPATNLLASIADKVISHPNVVNGALLELAEKNVLYVEGYMLDRFLMGEIGLREVTANKIGVILDSGCKGEECTFFPINTIDSIRTNKGINVIGYAVTERPVGGHAVRSKSGPFLGVVDDPGTFLDAARKLIASGANAIAVATYITISQKDLLAYFRGECPNPYGGTEALISHTISKVLGVPCAHAPLLTKKEIEDEMFSGVVDSRAGAEAASPAYLGSVLQGLHKAPQPVPINKVKDSDLTIKDVQAVILPASCLGGVPALAAEAKGIPIIAVKENKTVLDVTADKLGLKNVIQVDNYLEAAGVIACMKAGIDWRSVRRPLGDVKRVR